MGHVKRRTATSGAFFINYNDVLSSLLRAKESIRSDQLQNTAVQEGAFPCNHTGGDGVAVRPWPTSKWFL